MNISDNFRRLIVKEIKYAASNMDKGTNPEEILYYFSAVHGVIQRVFNLEYDPELIYAHFILSGTHATFMGRLTAMREKHETAVTLFDKQFKRLIVLTKELANKMQKKTDINETLKKFVLLGYTTTGNGYYLFQKGLLKI